MRGNVQLMGLWRMILATVPDFVSTLRSIGLFIAALAVPWQAIPRVLGIAPPSPPPPLPPDEFKVAMDAADAAHKAGDHAKGRDQGVRALEAAARTPGPEDDIKAIVSVVARSMWFGLDPRGLRLAVRRVADLAKDKRHADKVAQTVVFLLGYVSEPGLLPDSILAGELGSELARTGKSLVGAAGAAQKLPLGLAVAKMLLRLGKAGEAAGVLGGIRQASKNPDQCLQFAELGADVRRAKGDHHGAADVLTAALAAGERGDVNKRVSALQKLISVWPADRTGIDRWLGRFDSETAVLGYPGGSRARLTTAAELYGAGRTRDARVVARTIDLDRVERESPELGDMVRQVRQRAAAPGARAAP